MKLIDEMKYDMDFNSPKVALARGLAVIENVKSIVMISETSLTVKCGDDYVSVNGSDFVLKEIFEGRLLIEGNIQGAEFYNPSSDNQNRRLQDR